MNRFACQYAIIRFLPYAETGEFANVGLALACPATGYFDARLMPAKKTKRITGFFEQLDVRIYREGMAYLKDELKRLHALMLERGGSNDSGFIQQAFAGLVRPREALLRFGETRVILSTHPEDTLNQLFKKVVERDFANKEYHDQLLIRGVRETLRKANLREYFKPAEIGNQDLHIQVPFVHERGGRQQLAIKPLNLAQRKPNLVYDTGGRWMARVQLLEKHNLLPDAMLFAVNMPDPKLDRARAAVDEILDNLRRNNRVQVAPISDAATITNFATNAINS